MSSDVLIPESNQIRYKGYKSNEFTKTRLEYIDGLRGFAVALVVIFHSGIWSGLPSNGSIMPVLSLGRSGVDLFLVLSGFCLFWPLVKNESEVRPLVVAEYARRRIRRICPPYYAAVLLTIGASYLVYRLGGKSWFHIPFQDVFPWKGYYSANDLISHALLFHGLYNSYTHSIDGAFWSLSLEWQFYILFPFLVWIARKISLVWAIAVPLLVMLLFRAGMKIINPDFLLTYVGNEICFGRWGEFAGGMLSALLLGHVSQTIKFRMMTKLLSNGYALCLSMCTALGLEHWRNNFFLLPLVWGIAFCILITYAGQKQNYLSAFLEWPPIVWLGTISYSVYLIHGAIFRVLSIPFSSGQVDPAVRHMVFLLAGPFIAVAVAFIFYNLFERPFLHQRMSSR